jgi:hypothetical protein
MSELVKTNITGYYKDPDSGMVINMNETEYHSYLSQKNQYKEYRATLDQVSELKKELEEMKKLFMEKIKNHA